MSSLRERVAAGDRRALARAFIKYRPFVLKVLREQGRHPDDLDDLVQNTFIALPECARECRADKSLGGCVATAAKQACKNFDCRKATNGDRRRRVHLKESEFEFFPDLGLNPEEAFDQRERVHHLSELMERLPDCERQSLIARELRGLRPSEIAERRGTTEKRALDDTSRARARLVRLAPTSPLADVFAAMPENEEYATYLPLRCRCCRGKNARSVASC